MNRSLGMNNRMLGVSLLELLVAVAIVGILGSIAYPSYVRYVVRANRAVAKTVLVQVADRQEQYFADNKRYANDLTQLGYQSNGFMVDDGGATVAAGDPNRIYQITLSNLSAVTFTASAAPQQAQASRDTECQTLTLTHTGARGGASANCW
ncbi:MAG: prepilin-type N-terminal cleavage/methylation domain-containing protein [Gammaproteobacteria bacterium]|nr:prepilin-type N-terminal cleavage/methylation domain-containing protein [Gammaproteobacteria bacterium]